MSTALNGFHIELSASTFNGHVKELSDPSIIKDLRQEYGDKWFLHWRDGKLYSLAKDASAGKSLGEPCTFSCDDHIHLGLVAARINDVLPSIFPDYEKFRQRPFVFRGRKGELVDAISAKWQYRPPLLSHFAIWPRYELDARLIECRDGVTGIGMFVRVSTRWQIAASLGELQTAGVVLKGLHVVRREVLEGERRLVGIVDSLDGERIRLQDAFDDKLEWDQSDLMLEGSRVSFERSLRVILGQRYELFETQRQVEEGKLLAGPGIEHLLGKMEEFLTAKKLISLAPSFHCSVVGRIKPFNDKTYRSVVDVPPGEYCFDPAKSKRSQYAWQGLTKFGPFSRETFPRRSPKILVVSPEHAIGKIGQFIQSLSQGVPGDRFSAYPGGFATTYNLHNPEFTTLSVPLTGVGREQVARTYRETIERSLSKNTDYDAAIVALPTELAQLPDAVNPYLYSKALLLNAGITVQECRLSTASQNGVSLQYILQNLSLGLYAKMGGIPWTVDQGLAVDDEVVIGMGTVELSGSRFEQKQRYVGITTVFRGDGSYLLSHLSRECPYDQYASLLAESTEYVLKELKDRNGWRQGDTVRVVFHAHKPLKKVDIGNVVARCVASVGKEQNVEFAFLTVSHDHPFVVTDTAQNGLAKKGPPKGIYVPPRGRIVQLGRFTRLLCTKGPSLIKNANTPLPRPILVHLHSDSSYRDLQYLSEQILRFTMLSWRSTLPSEDPVTIYYSELIAKLLARLRSVPDWSPSILNTRLRHSMWFL